MGVEDGGGGREVGQRAQELRNENAVLQILIQLLSALEHVHSKGIVHRDVKPANMIWVDASKPSPGRMVGASSTLCANAKAQRAGVRGSTHCDGGLSSCSLR